jgi:hypothetical protein
MIEHEIHEGLSERVDDWMMICSDTMPIGFCHRVWTRVEWQLRERNASLSKPNIEQAKAGLFDSAKWKAGAEDTRAVMACDLLFSHILVGKTKQEVLSLLGPSDEENSRLYYYLDFSECDDEYRPCWRRRKTVPPPPGTEQKCRLVVRFLESDRRVIEVFIEDILLDL